MKILRIGCFVLLGTALLSAQKYVISTVAGGAPPQASATALTAAIGFPTTAAVDTAGNLYFISLQSVFRLDTKGILTRVAGTSRVGYSGDGLAATGAQLSNPVALALDATGNLFIADSGNNRIRKVSTTGIITTVAGLGPGGFAGDGGSAVAALMNSPQGVAVDAAGNLYITDANNNRVRKVTPNGIITTVAGTGTAGTSGDAGPAIGAQLNAPAAIVLDGSNNLYIVDAGNNRVRRISASGVIAAFAGTGKSGTSGDGVAAVSAQLNGPAGLAIDNTGAVLIADSLNNCVRRVATGVISTVAGNGGYGFSGDGGTATSAQVAIPVGIASDQSGNFFIADLQNSRIRKVSTGGTITTVAGNGVAAWSGDGGPAASAQLASPYGVAADASGNLFIADNSNSRIRKISANGIVTTVAGNGTPGFSGDGGSALTAQLGASLDVAVDATGNLFITDVNRVRKVSPGGTITTVAGNGTAGYSGDGATATSAQLNGPFGISLDASGNLFIADSNNNRIRKVAAGIITTVAGTGVSGFAGDGATATSAQLSNPYDVAVDAQGNLLIADYNNNRIRKVSTGGIITTVVGNGNPGLTGDDGPAANAQLTHPYAVAADATGNFFITDGDDQRVRRVSAGGTITTVVGNGNPGYSGDGGPSTSAQLNDPYGISVDGSGNLYIADRDNNAVRKLTPTNQSVLISAVIDAASESAIPVSPGKIVAIYGSGLGPSQLVVNQPVNGVFGTQAGGTTVTFNGVTAPLYYTSATQVAAIAPYEIAGSATAQVTVGFEGQVSSAFSVPVAVASPSFFTANATGAGEAAAINVVDGTLNTASNPVKIGNYISLYATGEGQTTPAGVNGKLTALPLPTPNLPVTATIDGIPATVQYKGGVYGVVAGLMQLNLLIPPGVKPGGYVPVVLQIGNASTVTGAVWIAVSN